MGEFSQLFTLVGSLLMPHSLSNCSKEHDIPSASEFLRNLEHFQVVLITISTILVLVILALGLLHWFYVFSFISIETRRNKLYWLIAVYPVASSCCFVAMLVPRTALILTAIGIFYYLMCLFVLVSLCRHLFGGRGNFSNSLQYEERPIDFRSPPFCCLIPRLPTARSSEKNICRLEWMVLQAPIVRAIVILSDVVAVAELRHDASTFLRYSDMASLCSLLLAIFGVHTLARVTSNKLSDYCFMSIFRLVDVSLFFFSAQQPIIFQNVLLRFNLIGCGHLLNAQENATFVCNFVIICEMFVLSLLATFLLSPRRSALFDRYNMRPLTPMSDSMNETEQSIIDNEVC